MSLVLLGFVLAGGVLVLLWRKTPWFLLLIRGGVLAGVLILMLNPGFQVPVKQKARVVVVADVSASMSSVISWEDSLIREMSTQDITVVSQDAKQARLPLRVDSAGRFTDLSKAFTRGADAYVLLSDGLHNSGTPVRPDAPVFAILPPKPRKDNLSLISVDCPEVIEPGRQMSVTIQFALNGANWRGRCRVGWAGQTVMDTGLILQPGRGALRVILPGAQPPSAELRVQMLPDPDVVDDPVDNSFSKKVLVRGSGLRVFIIADRPHPVVGALRQAGQPVPGLRMVCYIRTKNHWIRLAGDTVQKLQSVEKPDGPVIFAVGSSKDLSGFENRWPKMVFLDKDPWAIPGAVRQSRSSGLLANARGHQLVPDSLLNSAPPVKEFWRVPTSQSTDILMTIGPYPAVFFRGKDMFVATPELRAQNIATGGALFNALLSSFLDMVNRQGLEAIAWYDAKTHRIMARVQGPDGSPVSGVWPSVDRVPMNQISPGLFSMPAPDRAQATVEFYRSDTLVISKRLKIEPSRVPIEAFDYGVDTAFLRELALSSGGDVISDPHRVNSLLKPTVLTKKITARQMWFLFALPLGLALVAWGARRWRGMA